MTELTIRGLGGRRDTARARRLSAAYRGSTAVGLCMACALTLHAVPARAGGALPTNGQYVAGQGSISSSGSQLSVNQTSSRGIINWQGFSIGQGNSVFFIWAASPPGTAPSRSPTHNPSRQAVR